jgi:biotin carboxyl carrier protein
MKRYSVTVNGSVYDVVVEEADMMTPTPLIKPAPSPVSTGGAGSVKIESPMPGTIVDVKLSAGDSVQKGAVIAVLEAMKMENDIVTASSGTIVSVNVKKGDSVNTGTVIATMTAV